jgi:dTDP-3-amino-3,4,6-trideoxy-alpha-D-glucose transaminase
VLTSDPAMAARLRELRESGWRRRYISDRAGMNSRLDEMQAAILRARLPYLAGWTARRRRLAARYRTGLTGAPVAVVPECDAGHVYHLFVVRSRRRNDLQDHLAAEGIETLVHYPVPIPRQAALASERPDDCPHAACACSEVLSLPMHPGLTFDDIDAVVKAIRTFPQE